MTARTALDLCRWLQGVGLRPTCLLVAHAIGHRLGPDGTAWPSLRTLAGDTGLARSTVAVALRDLEDAGVLTRTRRTRPDGSRAATVYSFGGQWDLFRRKAAKRGGVVREPDRGSPGAGQAAFGLNGFYPERRAQSELVENHGGGAGLAELADVVERECGRAAALGHVGPWDRRTVQAFLERVG